jgi:hypothetical protein
VAACASVEIVIYIPSSFGYATDLRLDVDHAFTNVSGEFDPLKSTISRIDIHSIDGPQLVQSQLMVHWPGIVFDPRLHMRSRSGDLTADTVISRTLDMKSGGDITGSLLIAADVTFPGKLSIVVDKPLLMTCTGSGRIGLTKVFGSSAMELNTFSGDIIVDGGIGYVATDVLLNSTWGDIYMTSMILLAANHTVVHTVGGSITGTAVFSNDFQATTKYGSIAMIQAFIGLDTPASTSVPDPNKGVFPAALVQYPYVRPRLHLASEYGGIAMIGLNAGVSNKSTPFNEQLVVELTTVGGDIRVQVGGGAYVGPFSLETEDGARSVELNGTAGANSGIIGPVKAGSAARFDVRTKTGNIDFSAAANPKGILGDIFS